MRLFFLAPVSSMYAARTTNPHAKSGFTLIELSIVLLVIALIISGVLIGQNLIESAAIRAQLLQLQKYQTAVNVFHEKYGYLPGDIPDPTATQFGFVPRGNDFVGFLQGDGNEVITGIADYGWNCCGETLMFWRDLSDAKMLDYGLTTATPEGYYYITPTTPASLYVPPAAIGQGNSIYVYSNFCPWAGCPTSTDNYFGISQITQLLGGGGQVLSNKMLTVTQAFIIDTKIDDGLPITGNVLAEYLNGAVQYAPLAYAPSATSCADVRNNAYLQYSTTVNNGVGMNCAISIKMQ